MDFTAQHTVLYMEREHNILRFSSLCCSKNGVTSRESQFRSVVRREALKIPRVKRARLSRVGPGAEGGRERRRDWTGGLQEPSGLKYP
jgi:hypothetical protein